MYRIALLALPLAVLPNFLQPSDPAIDFEHVYERVAEQIRPGVVTITSTRRVRLTPPYGPEQLMGWSEPQGTRNDMPLREHNLGSGTVLSADGYILTNNHVVANATELKVHLSDKRTFTARVIGSDPQTDLAVVKIEATNLKPVSFGDSKLLKVGQWVAAFGSPYGLDQTMSSGIISAKSRASMHIVDEEDYVQTDANIHPGNSGGPLVDLQGQVIGINTALMTSRGYQGTGLAVPGSMARDIATKLMKDGKVVRGWIGVTVQEMSSDLAQSFGYKSEGGVLLAEVVDNSPAKRAGLNTGDILSAVDNKPVTALANFKHMVADLRPGTKAILTLWREGRAIDVPVDIVAQPGTGTTAVIDASATNGFGLELSDSSQGVLVVRVNEGSCADRCGLEAGDVLERIERTPLLDAAQARELLRARTKDGAALLIARRGTSRWLHLDAAQEN
jgi:Do/DeqQ family serine protease